jgi:hypothetical protein
VDLVGTSAPTPAAGHPFGGPSAPQDALAGETAEAWTFKQTVLLNPSARPTTVIVWTLVSGTGLLLLWSLLAPLGESVAVQGKLQPGRRVKQVEAPVAGVVAEVLVKDGEAVKAELRANTDAALAAGVFGVPSFELDGRVFWGLDALPMLREAVLDGAWFDGPAWAAAGTPRLGVQRG